LGFYGINRPEFDVPREKEIDEPYEDSIDPRPLQEAPVSHKTSNSGSNSNTSTASTSRTI
jgi:hypothetical protein